MKYYLRSVLIIFLLFAFTEIFAQIKVGYIWGMNLSTMAIKTEGLSSEPEMPAGVQFGGFLELDLTGNLTLQPRFLFSAKGSNYRIDTTDVTMSPVYIEVPVLAVYTIGSKAVRVSLFTGPYIACGIGGYMIETGSELKYLKFGKGEDKDLRAFDFGYIFGAGIHIKSFLISAQYGIGLTNVSPITTDGSEMKNKVIGISISSSFESKQ